MLVTQAKPALDRPTAVPAHIAFAYQNLVRQATAAELGEYNLAIP